MQMGDLFGHDVEAGEQSRGGQFQMKHSWIAGLAGAPDSVTVRGVRVEQAGAGQTERILHPLA